MKLTAITDSYNCQVKLTVEQFLKLEQLDFLGVVQPALEAQGADDIEYDGHFGPFVFFTVQNEREAQDVAGELGSLL